MKGLEEIDCNEEIWNEITDQMHSGWSSIENDIRFAFQTKSTKISEEDIYDALGDEFGADQIEVSQVDVEEGEPGMRYFGASVIIYESGI